MTDNWQPIDSAPKDCTLVLLLDNKASRIVTLARFAGGGWHDLGIIAAAGVRDTFEPTHWMAIPEPPQA
ncbi:hypothetical protein [Reyranella sp.]|uniref:hypothetical protein n=1 Tax=Reyranella sp. TaxID=1929291 RepID=UPI00122A8497|nr:hypothetical protein [Reyranella sp.]TAJ89752.1 MAG: hypothetical protein EPO50_05135 [Reyranella sp.]